MGVVHRARFIGTAFGDCFWSRIVSSPPLRNLRDPGSPVFAAAKTWLRPTKTSCVGNAGHLLPLLLLNFMGVVHRARFIGAAFGDCFCPVHHEAATLCTEVASRACFDSEFAIRII